MPRYDFDTVKRKFIALAIAILLALLFHTLVTSEEIVKLEVTPAHQFEPGTIRLKITVPTHKDNVYICFGYDSEVLSRRSCQQWIGVYAPRTLHIEYKALPAGQYSAFVQLYRAPNRLAGYDQAPFQVLAAH